MTNNLPTRSPQDQAHHDLADLLSAALEGDATAFSNLSEPHRNALTTHCYRMLGSLEDAEDQVQETFLRAWKSLNTYQGRATFRTWLFKIATNLCLDTLARRAKRTLPTEARSPADLSSAPEPPLLEPVWIEPFPDEWLAPPESNPEARYDSHESITFVFLIALQALPARQRCVLILSDVLDWKTKEIAELLDTSPTAVTSLLYRARNTFKQRYTHSLEPMPAPGKARQLQLLESYLQAWESADVERITSMLTEDAKFSMPPFLAWYQGRQAIREFLLATSLSGDAAGRWKLLPIQANGLPGFAFYNFDEGKVQYNHYALQLLRFEDELIHEVITFGFPGLVSKFNLPLSI
jgi:RNA polymerase sigma-70 factor, ECF subfamily